MKSKLQKIAILTAFILLASGSIAFAATDTLAQAPDVEEAQNETRESVDDLIKAKDENSSLDLPLRIKTFKEVIDLSIAEAKDLKINLLALDLENEDISNWREEAVSKINSAIEFYESEKESVEESEDSLTLEKIQAEAKSFKEWRTENYLPVYKKARNLLLIKKEESVLKTANNRLNKVSKDLNVLTKYSIIDEDSQLWEMLSQSEESIKQSEEKNEKAMDKFIQSIQPKEVATSTATSSEAVATGTQKQSTSSVDESTSTQEESASIMTTEVDENSTSSQTEDQSASSSTANEASASEPESLDSSIKGLVESSLKDVRGAYQVFIEMSSFVRELLQ